MRAAMCSCQSYEVETTCLVQKKGGMLEKATSQENQIPRKSDPKKIRNRSQENHVCAEWRSIARMASFRQWLRACKCTYQQKCMHAYLLASSIKLWLRTFSDGRICTTACLVSTGSMLASDMRPHMCMCICCLHACFASACAYACMYVPSAFTYRSMTPTHYLPATTRAFNSGPHPSSSARSLIASSQLASTRASLQCSRVNLWMRTWPSFTWLQSEEQECCRDTQVVWSCDTQRMSCLMRVHTHVMRNIYVVCSCDFPALF